MPTVRTHEAIIQAAVQAETSGVLVQGIKSVSVLASSINRAFYNGVRYHSKAYIKG